MRERESHTDGRETVKRKEGTNDIEMAKEGITVRRREYRIMCADCGCV